MKSFSYPIIENFIFLNNGLERKILKQTELTEIKIWTRGNIYSEISINCMFFVYYCYKWRVITKFEKIPIAERCSIYEWICYFN